MNKKYPSGYQPLEKQKLCNGDIDFSVLKCFGDTDCDSSPSAGWKFVKYYVRLIL